MRDQICKYCKILWERSFVAGTGGNVSVKSLNGAVLCTPTNSSKGFLNPDDLVELDCSGQICARDQSDASFKRPTSEIAAHLAIYNSDSKISAIIHTHPPYTCSYAFEDLSREDERELVKCASPEEEMWLGNLGFVEFYPAGSGELADAVGVASVGRRALVLKGHGLITWGESLMEAFLRTEIVESHFRIRHLIDSRNSNGLIQS